MGIDMLRSASRVRLSPFLFFSFVPREIMKTLWEMEMERKRAWSLLKRETLCFFFPGGEGEIYICCKKDTAYSRYLCAFF